MEALVRRSSPPASSSKMNWWLNEEKLVTFRPFNEEIHHKRNLVACGKLNINDFNLILS